MNLKIVIRVPNRQKLEEGNKQSRGVEGNKEWHERNPCFEQILNVLRWLLQLGTQKLMDYLTFISLCSVLWFVKQKGQQSLTYKRKDVITETTAKRLFAAEMSMKKGKKTRCMAVHPVPPSRAWSRAINTSPSCN